MQFAEEVPAFGRFCISKVHKMKAHILSLIKTDIRFAD
jgi:hypothetical protein